MQIANGGVPNLKVIPVRNHYDLQNLNYSDDHLLYIPASGLHTTTAPVFGLFAALPASPTANSTYIATDTMQMFFCYVNGTWVEITGVVTPKGNTQGDIMYNNGAGWQRLAAGTSGNYFQTKGAGQNPIWAPPPAVLYFNNTFSRSMATSTGTTVIPHGLASAPKRVSVTMWQASVGAQTLDSLTSSGVFDSSGQTCVFWARNSTSTPIAGNDSSHAIQWNDALGDIIFGTISVDATNITITWSSGGGSGVGTAYFDVEAAA